jgi:superfamily II DNA or RNA helicase
VRLAEEYAAEFTLRGITARAVSTETPAAERSLYLGAFKRGQIQVLTNVNVLTEGFDDPATSCCILARGCGSPGLYLQMCGRILRPTAGKRDAILLDLRGVSHEHGRPEDDREYSLEGRGISLRDPNSYCPVCGAPRTPPEPCTSCGYAPSGEDASKPDSFTGDKLKPYHAFRQTDDDAKRVERLARWLTDAARKGHKPGAAKYKFSAVYGNWPTAVEMAAANALARSRGAA